MTTTTTIATQLRRLAERVSSDWHNRPLFKTPEDRSGHARRCWEWAVQAGELLLRAVDAGLLPIDDDTRNQIDPYRERGVTDPDGINSGSRDSLHNVTFLELARHLAGLDIGRTTGRQGLGFAYAEAMHALADVLDAGPAKADQPKRPPRAEWLAKAMFKVLAEPHLTDSAIAKAVHIDASQLSRCDEYQEVADSARGGGQPPPGHVTVDRATGLRDVVPHTEDPEDR